MDFGLDLFDDVPPNSTLNHARPGSKFQPRAKPQPTKLTAGLVAPSILPCNATKKAVIPPPTSLDTTKSVQPVETVDDRGTALASSSLDSSLEDKEAIERNKESKTFALAEEETLFDLDPFSDTLPNADLTHARPGVKFQPITKPRPPKAIVTSVATSMLPSNAREEVVASSPTSLDTAKVVQLVDTVGDRSTGPVASSTGVKEPLENRLENSIERKTFKWVDEADTLQFYLDPFVDIVHEVAVGTERVGAKFQPKSKPKPGKVSSESVTASLSDDYANDKSDTIATCISDSVPSALLVDFMEDSLREPLSSPLAVSENLGPQEALKPSAHESVTPCVTSEDVGAVESLKSPSLEKYLYAPESEVTAPDGKDAGNSSIVETAEEAGSWDFDLNPPETILPEPDGSNDDIMPQNFTSSEFGVVEEQTDHMEASHLGNTNVVDEEDVPGIPDKKSSKSRKSRFSSESSVSQMFKKSSLAVDMNEAGKSSRQLRKRATAPQLFDEPEDEAPMEPAGSSGAEVDDDDYEYRLDEGRDDDGDLIPESASQKKRAPRKSKKAVAEEEKPVRKRKKVNETAEEATQKPPKKKFSRSTRRNRRYVNKDLLNIPEDEIDFQSLAIRDIIFLAEHKEREAIKEAKTALASSQTSSTGQRNEKDSHGVDSHGEEDSFALEQGIGHKDNQTSIPIQSSSILYNAQSFMDRAPTARWSKQDTELFYEGIRQFGTDLSMIQQLFPGRTRHQVKLKFKKEERQHPLRLSEALTNRAKDHSYFERVIEQLQEVAGQAERESNKDDSVCATGEDGGDLNAETTLQEEVAKSDMGVDAAKGSPLDSTEFDDDEDDIWSSYKTEF